MLYTLIGELEDLEWLALAQYYSVSTVRIMIHKANSITEKFTTTEGVKQGGSASPTFFNKVIDKMIELLKESGLTMRINGIEAGIIVYADDSTIITDDPIKMHQALSTIEYFCQKYDISINEKKTKWLKIGDPVREAQDGTPIVKDALSNENFKINNAELEKVDRFKLLGNY
jgi:hypothetical protein